MSASPPPVDPARLAVELAGHAYVWGRAVATQAGRILATDSIAERHVDCYLFVLALRQVLRCARAMDEAVGGDHELTATQERFLSAYPEAQTMRDVLSHFDEYEAGTGRLQRAGKVGALMIWLGVGEDSVTLSLASGLMLEVSGASTAAIELADATLSAQHRYLAKIRESRGAPKG